MDVVGLKKPDPVTAVFGPYAPVVKGSFILHGCNFAKLEGVGKGVRRARFLDGLREDIICEVGNGVRKEDILLNVVPGEIRSVVLSYESGGPTPQLLDADWDLAVAYAIRAKDQQRQANIAMAFFTALTTYDGLRCDCTRRCYVTHIDPSLHADDAGVFASAPPGGLPPLPYGASAPPGGIPQLPYSG